MNGAKENSLLLKETNYKSENIIAWFDSILKLQTNWHDVELA